MAAGVIAEEGCVILMAAAEAGQTRCVQALLALGASLEIPDTQGTQLTYYSGCSESAAESERARESSSVQRELEYVD